MSDTYSIAQAATIIDKPSEALRRAVDHWPIKPNKIKQGRMHVYAFELRDLVFYRALDDLKAGLTPAKQAEMHAALLALPPRSEIGTVEVGRLRYDFGPSVRAVMRNIEAVRKSHDLIDASGDEAVVKGTDVSAHRIAALCEGMEVEDIQRDYPSLTTDQIMAAKAFAISHPKVGRPYPKLTAKEAMRAARADPTNLLPTRR